MSIKLDGPILRARFPKPQPKDDRNLPTPWHYPTASYSSRTDASAAFAADRIDDLYRRCGDKPSTEVVALERVMVWASGGELATKREFLAAVGQRSPGADAYAAKLRKMNLKVCWGREPAMSTADVAQVRGRLQALHQKPLPDDATGVPGYMLKKPCKHCPFSRGEEAIRFSGRERATEILRTAWQNGFPCHESAVLDEDSGYRFGLNTQHCAGAMMMFIADGCGAWPGIGNDRSIPNKLLHHLDWNSPYLSSEEEFLERNTTERDREGHDDRDED